MKNSWSQLDSKFVEGLTPTEIDDVFIGYAFLGMNDCATAYDITVFFAQYPHLDTWEKVDNKTYDCIITMLEQGLVECTNAQDVTITLDELISQKTKILAIMNETTAPVDKYDFLFEITIKGYEFMKNIINTHLPIIVELDRLTGQDIHPNNPPQLHIK